jgi:arginase family enzyme
VFLLLGDISFRDSQALGEDDNKRVFAANSLDYYSSITQQIIAHCLTLLRNKNAGKMLSFGGDHYVTYPILLSHR